MNDIELINDDCLDVMNEMESGVIDFIMFSPPYDVNKEYEEDLEKEEYTELLSKVMSYSSKVLKDDGRFCIVVPFRCGINYGRWSRLKSLFTSIERSGMNLRDLVVWNQRDIQGTAWGSWGSASSPNIQYQTEYIVIGYNEQWNKKRNGVSTITENEFKEWTISNIWNIKPHNKSDHPAPYPEELVERCIKLLTFKDATILDPMCGSGTTGVVSKRLNRDCICIDKESKYIEMTKRRLSQTLLSKFEGGIEL